jgi:hypothetical protein
LTERWRQPVGVNGYHSVYDYVRRNIEDSVIDVQSGPLYYLYGADFSNTLLIDGHPLGIDLDIERPEADYTVVFGSPEFLNTPEWEATWLLVYEDGRGRVYQRRSG